MSENNETTKMENYSNIAFKNTTYSNPDEILNKQFLLKVDDEKYILNTELNSPCLLNQLPSRLPPPPPPPPIPPPPQLSASNNSLPPPPPPPAPSSMHQLPYSTFYSHAQPLEYEHRFTLETPPNSASCSTTPESKSNERLSTISRSQPDLTRLNDDLNALINRRVDDNLLNTQFWFPGTPIETCLNSNCVSIANRLPICTNYGDNVVDYLKKENHSLRLELDGCFRKISKLQKMEIDLQKIHQAHEDLMISSEKKEKLERTVRYKLEIELRRLQQQNKTLKEQLNAALSTIAAAKKMNDICLDGNDVRNEIQKRDVLIAQLLSQNKELIREKERQEIELQAQRLTLEEQRNHIETLDNALMAAQSNVVKLETELRKQVCYEEKAKHLQKALINLQMASERRLKIEKRARNNLEKEIDELKQQLNDSDNRRIERNSKDNCISNGANNQCGEKSRALNVSGTSNNSNNSENHAENNNSLMKTEIDELRSIVREYEEKIINLESEVTKWEQKYLEESTMRTIEVDAASVPKDAKIAALEKTSQESEKLIMQARNERLKHMDELHAANKKCAELEGKIRDQEAKLAERDAMIKVLQQHSRDKDEVIQKSLLAHRSTASTLSSIDSKAKSPFKHAKSASTMGLTNTTVGLRKYHTSIDARMKANTLSNTGSSSGGSNSNNAGANSTPVSSSSVAGTSSSVTNTSSGTLKASFRPEASIAENKADMSTPNKINNLEEQLKELDIRLMSKDSIIRALRTEKERYPNHYWQI